jgi:hypothetical protein
MFLNDPIVPIPTVNAKPIKSSETIQPPLRLGAGGGLADGLGWGCAGRGGRGPISTLGEYARGARRERRLSSLDRSPVAI